MADSLADPDAPLVPVGAGSSRYAAAFLGDFLAHTDQKRRSRAWLARRADALPDRRLLLDVGAGSGEILRDLGGRFAEVVAVEPNPELAAILRADFPAARVIEATLDAAPLPEGEASLTTLIHVLYYLPRAGWPEVLARLAATLRPGGELVAMLQRPDSDFQRLVTELVGRGHACDLRPAAERAAEAAGCRLAFAPPEDGEAWVEADSLEVMVHVAAFTTGAFLGRRGLDRLSRGEVAGWIAANGTSGARYRLSCAQEIAILTRP